MYNDSQITQVNFRPTFFNIKQQVALTFHTYYERYYEKYLLGQKPTKHLRGHQHQKSRNLHYMAKHTSKSTTLFEMPA